jgi:hypothetical protein
MNWRNAIAEVSRLAGTLIDLRAAGFTEQALAYPRDELAMRMLCAWAGCAVKHAPNGWRYFPNAQTKAAWNRVADAARDLLLDANRKAD